MNRGRAKLCRRVALAAVLLLCLPLLTACGGGTEIDRCLFVLALAVDPAPNGSMTVTVKALSGSQEGGSGGDSGSSGGSESGGTSAGAGTFGGTGTSGGAGGSGDGGPAVEQAEPGYVVMSATATSCLRAMSLLSATTPRTLDLSQLREVVVSQTIAETDATLIVLREIYSMFRANGAAVVVVTPDNAGNFVRNQRAELGVRLSQHLDVLFEHFQEMDTIPQDTTLSSVISAMESSVWDATAVYAADNDFKNTLVLPGDEDLNRLPGHLPRTAPTQAEYIGAALFSGPRMTATLTGEETMLLCILLGQSTREMRIIDGAQYKANRRPSVIRRISRVDGALEVRVGLSLTQVGGDSQHTELEIAAQLEREMAQLIQRLKAARSDAGRFGSLAIRGFPDVPSWEAYDWASAYENAPVRVKAEVRVL